MIRQTGQPKTAALSANLNDFIGAQINGIPERFPYSGDNQIHTELCVVSVDSRDERISLFEYVANSPAVRLFMDLRSGMSLVHIYAFKMPEEAEQYPETLRERGIDVPCSARAVAYNSFTVAGVAGGIVAAYAARRPFPRHVVIDHRSWAMIVEDVRWE